MLKRFLLIFVLAASLVAPMPSALAQRKSGGASAATAPAASSLTTGRRIAEQITAAQIKDYLYYIASDEMEGRDTPSRGLDLTAKFIATNLSRWGLKPAGDDGTYFQRIALKRTKIDPAMTRAEVGGQTFKFGDDLLAQAVPGSVTAPLIFVGHGWQVKGKNIDAYQGIDVKDKIMVILSGGLPKGVTFQDLSTGKQGVDWVTPDAYAEAHGAKGIIAIPNRQTLTNWERIRVASSTTGGISVEKFQKPGEPAPKVVRVTGSEKLLNALMQGEKQTAATLLNREQAEAIPAFDFNADKKVTISVGTKVDQVFTQNVVAIAEGKDSVLKNEYVALGAHYDHVGTGAPGGGRAPSANNPSDVIWNGADDDGSGTTALLVIAETLAKNPPPKRSVLFVWHCGEEKGLWGSRYFTENPTIPLDKVVTQINIDMIGRSRAENDANPMNAKLSGPNEVYVIGSKMMSTQLGELSESTNHAYLNLTLNYKYDDPKDPNRFFYRSDHYNYAKKGVPIIFYFDGEHEDYHRPGDEPQKIDYQKMEKVTRTVFVTMWELINRPTRPAIDKPLAADVTDDEH